MKSSGAAKGSEDEKAKALAKGGTKSKRGSETPTD